MPVSEAVTEPIKITFADTPVADIISGVDALFESNYEILKSWTFDLDTIDSVSVTNLILRVIPLLQTTAIGKSGDFKKQLAVELLRKLVEESDYASDLDRRMVLLFVDKTVPTLIDTTIGLAKQTINIGKHLPIKSCCTIS